MVDGPSVIEQQEIDDAQLPRGHPVAGAPGCVSGFFEPGTRGKIMRKSGKKHGTHGKIMGKSRKKHGTHGKIMRKSGKKHGTHGKIMGKSRKKHGTHGKIMRKSRKKHGTHGKIMRKSRKQHGAIKGIAASKSRKNIRGCHGTARDKLG